MAPSLEINCKNDTNISLQSNHKLIAKNEIECERINSGQGKGDAEEKVRTYRADISFTSRKEEADAIRNKFPSKIPIIVNRFHKESNLPQLERSKFLVPQEITMSQFVRIIRNRMKLGSNQAFYILVNNRSMLSLSKTLAEVYRDHKEKDGFLYMTYASQEVFG